MIKSVKLVLPKLGLKFRFHLWIVLGKLQLIVDCSVVGKGISNCYLILMQIMLVIIFIRVP
jgi:hypothetical protein